MTSKQHHKHTKLARRTLGYFCQKEWAIVGSTCEVIGELATEVIKSLAPKYKAAWLDATHKEEAKENTNTPVIEYTSHPSGEAFFHNKKFSPLTFRQIFNEADFALVNGNHMQASAQVVIIDEVKVASLKKRLHELTDVQLILLKNEETPVFDFIKQLDGYERIPIFPLKDKKNIIHFFENKLSESIPPLHALVLAGGKSMRMGLDKTGIHWHGKEQRYYMADLLSHFSNEVFISCRPEQAQDVDRNYNTLADTFTDLGPYGAILSAFRSDPNAAWLVIASDLPLLDHQTLQQLISHRDPKCFATSFIGSDGEPEPLITIWEPKSYPLLLAQLSLGYSCPRKLLLNSEVKLLTAADTASLMNVNTPEQAAEARKLLEKKLSKT